MSRKPILATNSNKIAELRKQGYKSLLEKYPAVRDRLVELWKAGSTYRECRRKLCQEFPPDNVPSEPSLRNYIEKYVIATKGRNSSQIVKVTPYALDIDNLLKELDPIIEFGKEVIPKAKREYENACRANLPARTRMGWFKIYADMIEKYNSMLRTTKAGAIALGELEQPRESNAQVNNLTFINNLSVDANKNNWKLAMKAYERLQNMADDLKNGSNAQEADIIDQKKVKND